MNYKTKVNIAGKSIYGFEEITLTQKVNEHHEFTVTIDHDAIEKRGGHTLDKSKEWLGATIVISFAERTFVGIITNITLEHQNGLAGTITLKGYSKTFVLDQGKHTRSWKDKLLEDIVKDVLPKDQGLSLQSVLDFKLHKNPTIPYQVQYQENNFTFLQRLARDYACWLYYDGVKMIFGKPIEERKGIDLYYGRELTQIKIGMHTEPVITQHFSYDASQNFRYEIQGKDNVQGIGELADHALKTSKKIYRETPYQPTTHPQQSIGEIETTVHEQQATQAVGLSMLEATCNVQGLMVGDIINIRSEKLDSNKKNDHQIIGQYRIIAITHKAASTNKYEATIKAVHAEVRAFPAPSIATPQAGTQIAKVIDNADPKELGRIRVQFLWQKEETSNWMRVLTPDAGSSSHHNKNRGQVFIPEIGDQVMVGFRYNDPNRPFVLGSMYHAENGEGGSTDNSKKSIITRSGHTIEFNDTDRQESITITDKSKNIIFIDTANSSIRISAPESIDIEAKNINIRASEKLYQQANDMETQIQENKTVGVGNNLNITVENDYSIDAQEFSESIHGSKSINITNKLEISSSETSIRANSGDMKITSAATATVQGATEAKVSKG